MRTCLALTVVMSVLLMGCLHSRVQRAPIPPPPPDLPTLPPPPTVQQVDEGIGVRTAELKRLQALPRPVLGPGRTADDLDREIQERVTRIQFIQAELEALMQQRKASELYYRHPPAGARPAASSSATTAEVAGAAAPPSLAAVDERIELRRSWISRITRRDSGPTVHRSAEELDREIAERETRIAFLKGEIEALILQRKASEIYYRQSPPKPVPK